MDREEGLMDEETTGADLDEEEQEDDEDEDDEELDEEEADVVEDFYGDDYEK